jgi:RNA polymerase sigma-70 factor (ECF subfamily)
MTISISRHAGQITATFKPAVQGDTCNDERLIERIAQGDQLAMRALFVRHRVKVYRFVLRLVGNPASAEDVLSEVFLEAWRHASRFTFRTTVPTWLLAIARRKAMSELRRRKDLELDADIADNLPDQSEDPEAAVQRKAGAQALQRALADLSPAHAEVLELVYYHGKSVKAVAVITGVPEATVKTRMFYARKRLADVAQAITA